MAELHPETAKKRRGAQLNTPNRFERMHASVDDDHRAVDDAPPALAILPTETIDDNSRSIVVENDSPDVFFRYSINPYRGCEHGCSYCYARPYHEYLGFSAGVDFETKIVVKRDGPALLRKFLLRPQWRCEPIAFSGVTDCYQPLERELRITRGCLEVLSEFRQPVQMITKSQLIIRDIDLLSEMARRRLAHVAIALTTLDERLAREMEPRAALPKARLAAIRQLTEAGIPVGVLAAPIIPGLTDEELPAILQASSDAGAHWASYVLLRLPGSVETIFCDWLDRHYPLRKSKVLAMIRATRGGELTDPRFGKRMKGTGNVAEQIARLFKVFRKRTGLNQRLPELDCTQFRRPMVNGQGTLFEL